MCVCAQQLPGDSAPHPLPRPQVERSQAAASEADVVVMVVDAAAGWTEADGAIFRCGQARMFIRV